MEILRRSRSFAVPDVAMDWLLDDIQDPRDRAALSLVCHNWYAIDAKTRKHVTISPCYSARPDRLCSRFPHLESVTIKGKPRASMYQNLIPEDWGGYAGPWVAVIADGLIRLKSVHFRRMTVTDEDIGVLVRGSGHMFETLKLDKCSGFSTNGLLLITRRCRKSITLYGRSTGKENVKSNDLKKRASPTNRNVGDEGLYVLKSLLEAAIIPSFKKALEDNRDSPMFLK